jgi:hypothetical protein
MKQGFQRDTEADEDADFGKGNVRLYYEPEK